MIQNGLGQNDVTYEADVCVVGAGAAGLTLTLDLARQGIKVVLVESGGLEFTWRSHKLLDIELGGKSTDFLVKNTRLRYFGGTTNHWGGVSRPLDPFEFEVHSWVPNSGWPISRADLDPYYSSAAKLLGLPTVERVYDSNTLGVTDHPRLVNKSEPDLETVIWQRAAEDRKRLGQSRRGEIRSSPLIHCVLNTTIVELHSDASGKRITSLEGRTFDKGTLHFRAKDYVLCTGAIENPRLLLASDSVIPGGIGNTHDLVGRYFMDHGGRHLGHLLINPTAPSSQEELLSKDELVGWSTTLKAREEYQLLGFMAFLIGEDQKQLPHELAIRKLLGFSTLNEPDTPAQRRLGILMNMEQSPNPHSRVMLSDKRDSYGVRKPLLTIDVTKQDLQSAVKSAELLSLAVARSGLGRIHLEDISNPINNGGGHQMGTTRMSNDPKHGVTDANGRVHSVENLYIGGSSLYPTGGWQHPTFTIIALALRLSNFLGSRIKLS